MIDFFLVTNKKEYYLNDDIPISFFLENRLFKTYSLFLSYKKGINIPPTALFLDYNRDIIDELSIKWGLPLMIRMDYKTYQFNKFLGGIPIYSKDSISRISKFLLSNHYYPLIHPNINRFEDIYSFGILFDSTQNDQVVCEVVGQGFDASDLRLGFINPHETIMMSVNNYNIIKKFIISHSEYLDQVILRKKRIEELYKYTEYVNVKSKLLTNFKSITNKPKHDNVNNIIPNKYSPVADEILKEIHSIVIILKKKVISRLPNPNVYTASLSLVPKYGIVLWDIYGSWYLR